MTWSTSASASTKEAATATACTCKEADSVPKAKPILSETFAMTHYTDAHFHLVTLVSCPRLLFCCLLQDFSHFRYKFIACQHAVTIAPLSSLLLPRKGCRQSWLLLQFGQFLQSAFGWPCDLEVVPCWFLALMPPPPPKMLPPPEAAPDPNRSMSGVHLPWIQDISGTSLHYLHQRGCRHRTKHLLVQQLVAWSKSKRIGLPCNNCI